MRTTAFRAGLAAAVLTGLTAFLAPATAQAADGAPAPKAVAADGNFYAYEYVGLMGGYCAWSGDDANWSSCSPRGGIRNEASSVENRGFPGAYEDVLVYWDNADDAGGWDGARACIQNGWSYGNLYWYYFPENGAGGGEKMENNISAHRWVHSCTEDPL
ncbi:hypothetical protein ACFYWX_39020 [Streptomyces sp. NPDC002888]|uniref:hypothetical protein n=1 Tax=Streptomyces sp. NPDC002888 TaxID=3364668 RepID=UPI0036B28A83